MAFLPFSSNDNFVATNVKGNSRLTWVMVLRVVIISALLGATIVMNRDTTSLSGASTRFLLGLIVSTYFLTIIYAVWYRLGKKYLLLGYIQFSADAILFGALTYSTGGASSGFTFLFHLWVIVAVVSMGKRAGYIQATVSTLVLAIIIALMELNILPLLSDQEMPELGLSATLYAFSVNVISLYIVASLVSILAARLEFAGEGLQKERAQKEELTQKLEHAKRLAALGELAATLAHEIRNPLSAVSGSFQMLQSGLSIGEDDKTLVTIIDRELDRMARLVEDILEYARPRKPDFFRVDLLQLCKETVHSFEMGIVQRGIQIEIQLDQELFVKGDSNQLKQVLWNLLVNAGQSVADDTGKICVSICCRDENAVLRVADNGPGIPAEIQSNIFDAFFSTKERGMGLGLALCARIVSAHNGTVQILDEPEMGAVFQLTLPVDNQ